MTATPLIESRYAGGDGAMSALAMALFVLSVGYAIDLDNGYYSPRALLWLTISLAFCAAAIVLPAFRKVEWFSRRSLALVLAVGIAIQTALLMARSDFDPLKSAGFAIISALGLLQFFYLRRRRIPVIVIMTATFLYAGGVALNRWAEPDIDVYTFQQSASVALMRGSNPYEVRTPTRYPHSRFYGPGLVDQNGYLTFGFPYPPLSLLMVLPGFLVRGDIRYAQLVAVAVSVVLMALARPGRAGRIGALAGVLFLTTPCVFLVLTMAWTEPLLVLNFSLVMFCACRWRKGLPWALGLFFATKQYTVLALPLLPLLVHGPGWRKELRGIVVKAGILVAVINLPFLLWNVREFTRGVVLLQFVQPFRTDALSYLVWLYSRTGGVKPPIWIPLLVVIPVTALALWRGTRSPAGFAAALTLVNVLFFAFNKQAFCNYYYFVIATACWSVAAAKLPLSSLIRRQSSRLQGMQAALLDLAASTRNDQ